MNQTFDLSGPVLQAALFEPPHLTLSFYSYGVLLRQCRGDEIVEYAVDPAQIALSLASKISFDTGLLSSDTLLVRQEGVKKTVVGFRHGGKTGIWLEGSETPLRVALPPLVLIRQTSDDTQAKYQLYAVKRRPQALDEALFHAPLPNIFSSGSICWGTVQTVSTDALKSASLAEDFAVLLGTRFNSHGCSGKSKSQRHDIRAMLTALEKRKARVYPKRDLLPVNKTLGEVLS